MEFGIKASGRHICLEKNAANRIENLKEMPSLVKGREEETQKDDQTRDPILLMSSAESGTVGGRRYSQKKHWSWSKHLLNSTSQNTDREGRKKQNKLFRSRSTRGCSGWLLKVLPEAGQPAA